MLVRRFDDLGLSGKEVVEDAKSFGMNRITASTLSKYLNSYDGINQGSLTEYAIYWLCIRYNIDITITAINSHADIHKRFDKIVSLFPETREVFRKDSEKFKSQLLSIETYEKSMKSIQDL